MTWKESHAVRRADDPDCLVSVVLPVRDEAERLPRALDCLANQVRTDGSPLDPRQYEVLVLANNCSDNSAEICRAFGRSHPGLALHVADVTLPDAEATVGYARRLLMQEASTRLLSLGDGARVIASSDGDTRAAPDWVAATLEAVGGGADAVAGRILLDAEERRKLDQRTRRALLQSVGYAHAVAEYEHHLDPLAWDPWPRHGQHFGASFALTASMYRRSGGIPPTAENEDVRLYKALLRVEARIRHSPGVRVWTSGRLDGRVRTGLAAQLGSWAATGPTARSQLVEAPYFTGRRLAIRRALRRCWADRPAGLRPPADVLAGLAVELCVGPSWLAAQLAQARFFGAVWERLGQRLSMLWQRSMLVPIGEAIVDLNRRCRALRLADGRLNGSLSATAGCWRLQRGCTRRAGRSALGPSRDAAASR